MLMNLGKFSDERVRCSLLCFAMMDQLQPPLSPLMEDAENKSLLDITLNSGLTPSSDFSQSYMGMSSSMGSDREAGTRSEGRPRSIKNGHDTLDGQASKVTAESSYFPFLGRSPPPSPRADPPGTCFEGEDEEPATAIQRSTSPLSATFGTKSAANYKAGEEGVSRMHKFSLYETASRYYLVGGDIVDRKFRVLKIDRTAESGNLSIAEDDIVYTKKEMNQLLKTVDDGNKGSGGLRLKCTNWGLLGFIRFTGAYYMLVITKRSQVALIGGHYIYQIDGTELVPLMASSSFRSKSDRDTEEARFIGILNNLDLSRSFYFSYSYNITRTLQQNIIREREALQHDPMTIRQPFHNAMFVWNHHFLQPVIETLKSPYDWCLPIVHGFIDQASKLAPSFAAHINSG